MGLWVPVVRDVTVAVHVDFSTFDTRFRTTRVHVFLRAFLIFPSPARPTDFRAGQSLRAGARTAPFRRFVSDTRSGSPGPSIWLAKVAPKPLSNTFSAHVRVRVRRTLDTPPDGSLPPFNIVLLSSSHPPNHRAPPNRQCESRGDVVSWAARAVRERGTIARDAIVGQSNYSKFPRRFYFPLPKNKRYVFSYYSFQYYNARDF